MILVIGEHVCQLLDCWIGVMSIALWYNAPSIMIVMTLYIDSKTKCNKVNAAYSLMSFHVFNPLNATGSNTH